MIASIVFSCLVIVACLIFVLRTVPTGNEFTGTEVITHYMLGNTSTVSTDGAVVGQIPESATNHLIRTNGTSIGHRHSGHFKNTRTGDKFLFYLCGKGVKVYFENNGDKYLVDLSEEDAIALTRACQNGLVVGGYTDQREPTEEEVEMFRYVTGEGDMVFTPLSVSTQVVAGTNYRFYCRTEDTSKPEGEDRPGYCYLTIFKPLPGMGNPKLSKIEQLEN